MYWTLNYQIKLPIPNFKRFKRSYVSHNLTPNIQFLLGQELVSPPLLFKAFLATAHGSIDNRFDI